MLNQRMPPSLYALLCVLCGHDVPIPISLGTGYVELCDKKKDTFRPHLRQKIGT